MRLDEPRHTATGHLVGLADGWALWRVAALRSAGMPFDWLAGFGEPDDESPDRQSRTVRWLLTEPRFLEAIAWQNPAVTRAWVGSHARALRDGQEIRRTGRRQALIARFAQRYCAKNDTIGFFGPVAWARFTPDGEELRVTGTVDVRERTVHLESWAVHAITEAWAADPKLRTHLPARLHGGVTLEPGTVVRPWRDPLRILPATAEILGELDGRRTLAQAVAAITHARPEPAGPVERELAALCAAGVIVVGFATPLDARPERQVRAQVGRIEDAAVRGQLLGQLDGLAGRLAGVAAAAGDPVAVHRELDELTALVGDLANRTGYRDKAECRQGRSVAYTDARCDLDVDLGATLLDQLRDPLTVLLRSAAWLAAEVADAVEDELRQRYRTLARGPAGVRLSDLYFAAADVLSPGSSGPAGDVVRDFRLRWAELLRMSVPGSDGQVVRLATTDVLPRLDALFPARAPAWSGGRYHSPDLLLASTGDGGRWIVGELHVALNTLEGRVFHTHAEHRADLAAWVGRDMAAGRVVAVLPADSPEVSPRTYPPLTVDVPGRYVHWTSAARAAAGPDVTCWPATALMVYRDAEELLVRAPDGAWQATLLEVLGEFLTALVVNEFRLRDPAPHLPRLLLDEVVVARRSWRLPAARVAGTVGQLATLRRPLCERGVPRHLYARTAAEPKPCYVDRDAPLLLRNLARMIRLAQAAPAAHAFVEVTEMLPGPDELWLRGASGERYTAEFRAVAVDPRQARGVTRAQQPGMIEEG